MPKAIGSVVLMEKPGVGMRHVDGLNVSLAAIALIWFKGVLRGMCLSLYVGAGILLRPVCALFGGLNGGVEKGSWWCTKVLIRDVGG